MYTADPYYNMEEDFFVEILYNTYKISDLDKVIYSSTQLNSEGIKLLLELLNKFDKLFYVTLGKCNTSLVYLYPNLLSKPINFRY